MARRGVVLATVAAFAILAFAGRASADLIYWDNYENGSVSFANLDGTGGGPLNLGGIPIDSPEGMAYDSVTNRLFVANEGIGPNFGEILAINLDGSGAALFAAPGALINDPQGIAIDPGTRTIYWYNAGNDTFAWARLDGSVGGPLDKTGATENESRRIALDPVAGRIYFGSNLISFVNVDGSGGGDLNVAGATPPTGIRGFAVDQASARLFWLEDGKSVSFASLGGGAGGDLDTTGGAFVNAYGLALDPVLNRLYWANYGSGAGRLNAFGFDDIAGPGGNLTIATAPINGPQDPLIIKSPASTAPPQLGRAPGSRSLLTCSQGAWAGDYPGSFVYQAPRTYAYAWFRGGATVPGATGPSLEVTQRGAYSCAVTATNHAGATTATAAGAVTVAAAKLKVLVRTKVRKAKRGKKATFRVQYYNQGDLISSKPRVCVQVPKKLRKLLKAPKCRKLGRVSAKGRRTAKFRVFVRPGAKNKAYRLKFVVKGVPSKRSFGRLRVLG